MIELRKIFFLVVLFIYQLEVYAVAPPSLPPAATNYENDTNKDVIEDTKSNKTSSSILDMIKKFFYKSEKPSSSQSMTPEKQNDKKKLDLSANDPEESFIDIGNTKLPTAADNYFGVIEPSSVSPMDKNTSPKTTDTSQTRSLEQRLQSTLPSTTITPISTEPKSPTMVSSPVDPAGGPEKATLSSTIDAPTAPLSDMQPRSSETKSKDDTYNTQVGEIAESKNTTSLPVVPTEHISESLTNNAKQNDWDMSLKPVEVIPTTTTSSSSALSQEKNKNEVVQTEVIEVNKEASAKGAKPIEKTQNLSTDQEKIPVIIKKEVPHNDAIKFAKDEVQELLLPDDDLVLGKLTKKAQLEHMDMYKYIKLFRKEQEWRSTSKRRNMVKNFVKYAQNIDRKPLNYSNLSHYNAKQQAFRATKCGNLLVLRTLLNYYPILQEKDSYSNTLLDIAVYNNHYFLTKFLIMRGGNISSLNACCHNATDIAFMNKDNNIICLLNRAQCR